MTDANEAVQKVIDDTAAETAARTGEAVATTVKAAEVQNETVVTAAEQAIALNTGAAALSQQAVAEREGQFYEGVRTWQEKTASQMVKLETELAATREENRTTLSGIASEISSLAQRLSTPQKSGETVVTKTTVDPVTGAETVVKEEVVPPAAKTKPRVRFI